MAQRNAGGADFTLVVGIDTKASLNPMIADVQSLIKGIEATNPKIKIGVELDPGAVNEIKKQTDRLSKRKPPKTSNSGGHSSKTNIDDQDTKLLVKGTKEHYNALKRVDNLLSQINNKQKKWTAAKNGASSEEYKNLEKYADKLSEIKNTLANTDEMKASDFDRKFAAVSSGVATASKTIREAGEDTSTLGARFGKMASKLGTWTTVTGAITETIQAVRSIVNNVKDIDSAMIGLKKVTNETDEAYAAFLDRATSKSQKMGISIKDTINATAEFAKLGKTLNESEKLSEAATIYKNVGDMNNVEDASSSIISTMQAFGLTSDDAMSIIDKFNEVGNNYAISSEGIGDALQRSASSMKVAGNTLDQTIALTAAANTVVQDPEKVGTSLKTVSMFLRAAKTEAEEAGESTDGMASSVSELRDELLALTGKRVDIQLDENTFKSTYQILQELSSIWGELTDTSKANILEMIGGKRNSNVVSALLENFSIAEEALQSSLNSEGSARKEYEQWLDSIEAKQMQLKAAWEGLSIDFLSADFVKVIVDSLRGLVNGLDAVVDSIGSVGTIAAGVGIKGLMKFTAKNGGMRGLLSLLTKLPPQALAVVAAITAIGTAAYFTKKHFDNIKTGAYLDKEAEQIKEHADKLVELNNLSSEVNELELIINTPTSTQEQIDGAKQRLEEIYKLVNEKYEINIKTNTDDTTELKKTLSLLSRTERESLLTEGDDYTEQLKRTDYKGKKEERIQQEKRAEDLDSIYNDLKHLSDLRRHIAGKEYTDPRKKESDLYKYDIEIADRYKKIEDMGYGHLVGSIKDTPELIAQRPDDFYRDVFKLGAASEGAKNNLSKTEETIKNYEDSAEKASDAFAKALASDINMGDKLGVEAEELRFKTLGETLRDAGASTEYLSQGFAISKQGLLDMNSAIEAGALDNVAEDYIKFKEVLGENPEDAIRGAALLKQGFTEVSQVTDESVTAIYDDMKKLGESHGVQDAAKNAVEGTAIYASGFNSLQEVMDSGEGGINKFLNTAKALFEHDGLFSENANVEQKSQELTEFAHSLGLIPENKSVKIDAETGGLSVINETTREINEKWGNGDKKLKISVNTETTGEDINEYEKKVEKLDNKDCEIEFNANGTPAKAVIGDISYNLENYDESTGTATLYAEDGNAIGTIDLLNNKIELLPEEKIINIGASETDTSGIDEYASIIDGLRGEGKRISFRLDVNGNTEVLNEAGEVISKLKKDENIIFHVDSEGNLNVFNTLTEQLQVLDEKGNVSVNVHTKTQGLGAFEGLKGDLEKLNGQECSVILSANNTPAIVKIGESYFALSNYDSATGEATITASNGEALAVINTTTGAIEAIPGANVDWINNAQEVSEFANTTHTAKGTVIWGNNTFNVARSFAAQGTINWLTVNPGAGARGTAFSKGSWGAKRSGTALGGELGQELVVRDGRFFTIGDSGAEFFTYKKDDIIFNADQTKQIFEKGKITHGNRRGVALADGNAFADGTNNLDRFNSLYRAWDKIRLSADILIDDIIIDNDSIDESLEEELKKIQERFDKTSSSYEHRIFLMEKHNVPDEELLAVYKKIQKLSHDEAEEYRAKGLDENSEYIQKTQQQWWDAQDKINEILANGYEENREQIERTLDFTNLKMKEAVESRDFSAVSDYTDKAIALNKSLQESVHEQAEYYRSLGYAETSKEISELVKLWWEYQENIKEAVKNGYDALVEKSTDSLNAIQKVYDTLKSGAEDYAETGNLSSDFLSSLSEIGIEYMSYLEDENGMLVINKKRINDVIAAKTKKLAIDTALSYIEKLELALTNESIENVNKLIYAKEGEADAEWALVYAKEAALNLDKEQHKLVIENLNKYRSIYDNAIAGVYAENAKDRKNNLDDTKDALDTILDLTMDLVEYEKEQEIEALEKQKEAYREIIDLKKEALESTKDENDYNKEVEKKISEIAKLQSKINKLSLDDSREAQAEKASLEEELAELQEELADYQADYGIEKQTEMLDKMADAYDEEKDKEIESVEKSVSSTEKIYQLAIERINSDWDRLYKDILSWNYEAGSTIESEIVNAWELAAEAVKKYGSFVNAVDATTPSDGEEDHSILGESGKYGDPEDIKDKMRQNSLAWFTTYDPNRQQDLQDKNNNHAEQLSKIYGKKVEYRDGSWYLKGSNKPIYEIGTWEAVDYITKAMRINSEKWKGASASEQTRLELANEKMAQYIEELSGQKVWKDDDGRWWIGSDDLFKSYGKYHTGGVVGDSTLKQDEVMAILQNGEMVLDKQREKGLYKLVDFAQILSERLGTSIDTASFREMFGGFSLLPALKNSNPVTHRGASAVEFSPKIEVNISHNGAITDNDARRYGDIAAETAISSLKDAFAKRGITSIGGAALKSR